MPSALWWIFASLQSPGRSHFVSPELPPLRSGGEKDIELRYGNDDEDGSQGSFGLLKAMVSGRVRL